MGRKCFVPGCKTGYESEKKNTVAAGKKNLSLFAPKDPDDLQKWKEAIPRTNREITRKDYVCELHFADDCIERSYKTKLFDGSTFELERGIPILKKGSVPTIFPSLEEYLSSHPRKRKPTTKRSDVQVNKIKIDTPKEIEIANEDDHQAKEILNFSALTDSLSQIKVPRKWWCLNMREKYVTFVCWDENFAVMKKIVIDSSLNVKIFLREQLVSVKKITTVRTIMDLSYLLQLVDELSICKNLQSRDSREIVSYCCGYVDKSETNLEICKMCRSTEKCRTEMNLGTEDHQNETKEASN